MDSLWQAAENAALIDVRDLEPALANCVRDGDGVADHYGGRTAFTFLGQRGDEVLVLERRPDAGVQARTVLNLTGGYGTGILGDEVKALGPAFGRFLDAATTTNDEFHSLERARLVARIKRLLSEHTGTAPTDWDVSFTSTGSEAMDLALQLGMLDGFRLSTGVDERRARDVVVACHGAWHGWSLGPNQILDRRQFTEGLPRIAGAEVVFMQYGDIESLESVFAAYGSRMRAIAVEGILGDGGVVLANADWWSRLFALAAAYDVRVIDDEILTGFRTGGMLALPRGHAPDCVTLGKALGFGLFPMSAVAWRKQSLSLRAGIGVRTFNARPFQAAVVDAGLEQVERDDLFSRSVELGERLLAGLQQVTARHPQVFKAARGQGLFVGIELADAFARRGHAVRAEMLRHGVLVEIESGIFSRKVPRAARINETLRLTPPLTVAERSIELAISRIEACAAFLEETVARPTLVDAPNMDREVAL